MLKYVVFIVVSEILVSLNVQKLKNLFSIFLLIVFLFPMAEKGLHDVSHSNDIHCASSDKHFHSVEHHCNLCDFTSDITGYPSFTQSHLILYFPEEVLSSTIDDQLKQQNNTFCLLRGPPALV